MDVVSAAAGDDGDADRVSVRDRRPDDIEALVGIAERVRARDGYPVFLRDGDLPRFLTKPASLGAWVAEREGVAVGHVVLNAETSAPVMQLVAQRGHDHGVAFVARLLVDPDARRQGIGTRLLDHARRAATARGLVPMLDVVATGGSTPAIALYRGVGWRGIGRTSFGVADGRDLEELVFEGPEG